ncbi:MAG: serine hydrolase [Myxococcota bacterium]
MTTSESPRAPRDRTAEAPVAGVCDPRFAAVEHAFRENLRVRGELGGAVCVRIDGRTVVDLWGGHRDAERRSPWQRDTLVNVYSVGKGITAMLALALVERGELDLDRPVVEHWPEFAAWDKGPTTLRMLLAHRGGLPAVRAPLPPDALFDWSAMTRALADQAPYWTPGTDHGYHVNTHGFLVGEPIARRLGASFGRILRDRISGPHSADFHSGLAPHEHARVATLIQPFPSPDPDVAAPPAAKTASAAGSAPGSTAAATTGAATGSVAPSGAAAVRTPGALPPSLATGDPAIDAILPAAYFNPPGLSGFGVVNTAAWRSASIPSTNSHATARAVATLYDVFLRVDPDRGGFVGPGLRAEARQTASEGPDRILGKPSRFGLGFQLPQATRPIGGGEACFGHYGYGGSLGFADAEADLAFGYVMNLPGDRWQNARTLALVDAVYAALGARAAGSALA